jgi:DNA-directed RNA polymerase subunit M/transcription elongation factor TFIIS
MKSWTSDEFIFIYRIYTNNITKNLDNQSEVKNNQLLDRLVRNEINPLDIAFLTNVELFPEKSIHIVNKLNERTNQKIKLKTTSMYTCRNCKGKCATMQEIQLRRIDESANTKLTCVFCNNSWFI